jgi:hypothetical protein
MAQENPGLPQQPQAQASVDKGLEQEVTEETEHYQARVNHRYPPFTLLPLFPPVQKI